MKRSHQPARLEPVNHGLGSIQAVKNLMIQIDRGYEKRRSRREFLLHQRFYAKFGQNHQLCWGLNL